jgi:hypothetical protein
MNAPGGKLAMAGTPEQDLISRFPDRMWLRSSIRIVGTFMRILHVAEMDAKGYSQTPCMPPFISPACHPHHPPTPEDSTMRHHSSSSALLLATLGLAAVGLHAAEPVRTQPWPMHHIHDGYLIANSLDAADVNQDGHADYAVIDEWLGLQTVVFHPGPSGDVRQPWPRVVLGKTGNPEYSCLGDLDGDGQVDLVVVEGDDAEKGIPTGVRIWWSPPADRVMDPAAWTDSGHIPGTQGLQYLYCLARDLNGDGRLDILTGGRRHSISKDFAGIRILSVEPGEGARDLSRWTMRPVDLAALSGHGLVVADVNGDGRPDILNADADWDTPRFEQSLHWY